MKLISVQSNGNRLARVYEHPRGYGHSWLGCQISEGKFVLKNHAHLLEKSEALKAAAEWLKGAK